MFMGTKNVCGNKKRSYKPKLCSQSPNCNGSKMLSSVAHYDNELMCLPCMDGLMWPHILFTAMAMCVPIRLSMALCDLMAFYGLFSRA